jgi:hypothetical protein
LGEFPQLRIQFTPGYSRCHAIFLTTTYRLPGMVWPTDMQADIDRRGVEPGFIEEAGHTLYSRAPVCRLKQAFVANPELQFAVYQVRVAGILGQGEIIRVAGRPRGIGQSIIIPGIAQALATEHENRIIARLKLYCSGVVRDGRRWKT